MPWMQVPSLAHPRGLLAAATAAGPPGSGQQIYAVGGFDVNGNPVAIVEAYDPTHKSWKTTLSMSTARMWPTAAASPGRLHVMGGFGPYPAIYASHEFYDPAAKKWTTAAPMPTARAAFAAVTGPDGLIYAIGGTDGNGNILTTVEAYDPVKDKWTTKKPMQTPRAAQSVAAVALPKPQIYAIGGCTKSGQYPSILNSVEVYDISTDTWTPSSYVFPVASKFGGTAVGTTGVIFVIGGQVNDPEPDYKANAYSFDPAAPGWANRPPMAIGRAALAAATGPDGLIYAIGGMVDPPGEGGVTGDVEAYTYDKCDYIQYEIDELINQLAQETADLDDPALTPAQRLAAERALAPLRQRIATLETQLKHCRGG
jgi:N-acetylneuraminic acid mutarotase